MIIKILGSGCKKCVALGDNAKVAAASAGIDADIEKVTDIIAIAGYGIMWNTRYAAANKLPEPKEWAEHGRGGRRRAAVPLRRPLRRGQVCQPLPRPLPANPID